MHAPHRVRIAAALAGWAVASGILAGPVARVVDASGLFLIPGLADLHVHVYVPEELTLYAALGVTTVFNLDGRPAHLDGGASRAGSCWGTVLTCPLPPTG